MASYSKRKTKKGEVWGVRFRVIENGKEVNKNLSPYESKKKAEKAYREYMADYKPNYDIVENGISCIYNDLLELYLKSKEKEMKGSSLYELPSLFESFITPYFNKRDMRTITKNELFFWQEQLWSKTYIRNKLNNFLNYCKNMINTENMLQYIKTKTN